MAVYKANGVKLSVSNDDETWVSVPKLPLISEAFNEEEGEMYCGSVKEIGAILDALMVPKQRRN